MKKTLFDYFSIKGKKASSENESDLSCLRERAPFIRGKSREWNLYNNYS